MKISIVGCGWYGLSLAQALKKTHEISGTTRSIEKQIQLQQDGIQAEILTEDITPSEAIMNVDVMILNIPPFSGQLNWLKKWNWNPGTHLIFISSTSVYGVSDQIVDESFSPNPDSEGGQWLLKTEEWVKSFSSYNIIRFGGLLGETRHPGKYLSGKKELGQGNRPVNLVHLEDCVGFTQYIIEQGATQEIYNLVHPQHPTRKNYYTQYCLTHGLPLPEFKSDTQNYGYVSSDKAMSKYQFKKDI